MAISVRERILNLLDGERTPEIFCSCHLTAVTWAQMDAVGCYWPEAHTDVEQHVKLAESQHTLLEFDSVRSGFDVGIEAEAFGAEVNMGNRNSNVYVVKPAFEDPDSFSLPPNLFELGRFPKHFEALSILSRKYREKIPVYSLILGPLTLMGHLFGVEKIMRWPLKEKALFEKLLDKVADCVVAYGNRLIEYGADALALGDPTASANLISPKTFKTFLLPIYRKLREEIKGRILLHICGDTTPFLEMIPETNFSAFSFEGPAVEVKKAKQAIGDKMALFGNIPTVDVLMNGTVQDVRRHTLQAIEDGIDSVEGACSLPLQTSLANARAMSEVVREYNEKKGFNQF